MRRISLLTIDHFLRLHLCHTADYKKINVEQMNIEHRTSNVQHRMKKQILCIEHSTTISVSLSFPIQPRLGVVGRFRVESGITPQSPHRPVRAQLRHTVPR